MPPTNPVGPKKEPLIKSEIKKNEVTKPLKAVSVATTGKEEKKQQTLF